MLDWVHRVTLRAVEGGTDFEDSQTARTLVATGLLEHDEHAALRVTDAGRTALAASEPSRLERFGSWALVLGGVLLVVGQIGQWVS